jgi:hypothetical protein
MNPKHTSLLATALLAGGVLLAGCGASSTSTSSTAARAATTTGARTAGRDAATSTASTASSASGPLAFAECMRANGVPNFPDPNPGGGFNVPGGDNPAGPAFRAAQAKCQHLMGSPVGGPLSPGARTHPSAQTLAKLLRIARCMRKHGVPQFPDPATSVPSDLGVGEGPGGVITDFDGVILVFPATLNLQAPAYRQALTACGAPPLGLPH